MFRLASNVDTLMTIIIMASNIVRTKLRSAKPFLLCFAWVIFWTSLNTYSRYTNTPKILVVQLNPLIWPPLVSINPDSGLIIIKHIISWDGSQLVADCWLPWCDLLALPRSIPFPWPFNCFARELVCIIHYCTLFYWPVFKCAFNMVVHWYNCCT